MNVGQPRTRVSRSGLAEQVYEVLEQRIFDLEYRPGERLVIERMARELGVSTTPVREALNRLAAERVIAFEPYVGYTVLPEPTLDEISRSFEARLAIEGFAAKAGCLRASAAQIARMAELHDELLRHRYGGEFRSFVSFVTGNRLFHEVIVATSDNEYLVEAARNTYHDALVARTLHDRGIPDIEEIGREHEAIVEAFRARDPEAVYRAIEAHIVDGSRRLSSALSSVGSGAE